MQGLLIAVGIFLTSQVGDSDANRYSQPGDQPPPVTDSSTKELLPWDDQTAAPLSGSSVLPLRESEKSSLRQPPGDTSSPSQQLATPKSVYPQGGILSDQDTPSSTAVLKPSQLLSSLIKPPVSGQLAGREVTLAEVVADASSRDVQTRRIEAYWSLSAAATDYYLSLLEATQLQALRQSGGEWNMALKSLKSHSQVARHTALAAQMELQRLLGQIGQNALPLPTDVPHCGNYDTRFDEIFAGKNAPDAKHLHELILLGYLDLRHQAADVAAAGKALKEVSSNRALHSDGKELLRAYQLVALERRAFVNAVRNYNTHIARYTELASPGKLQTGRLVAMLIKTAPRPGETLRRDSIRRTGAEEELEGVNPESSLRNKPKTFDEGEDEPPSADEHSILVQPPTFRR